MTTESKHTPGPWNCTNNVGGEIDNTYWKISSKPKDPYEILRPDLEFTGFMTSDDAHLIAAAPELLEALKYIVSWEPKEWSPEKARELAKSAIAKAEGIQS